MASEEELKRLSETTALFVPFIPMFKNDPMAKIDIKARDIDRQVFNYNRRFKSWKDMIVIPNVPNSLWLGVWKSGLLDDALDVLEKLTYEASENQEDYETVAKKMLEHLTIKRGSKFTARVQFRCLKQAEKEPFNAFFLRLQSAAAPCRWNEDQKKENMIEQLIAGHRDERVRAILFDLDTDDLEKYVRKCEALEIATIQAVQVVNPSSSNPAPLPVDSNQTRGHPYNRGAPRGRGNFPRGRGIFRGRNFGQQGQGRCGWCGGQEHGQSNSERTTYCKARNYICQSCGCKGHYERCCRNSASASGQPKPQGQAPSNQNQNQRPNSYQRHLGQAPQQNYRPQPNQQQSDNVSTNYENELLYDYPDGEEEGHAIITNEEFADMERTFTISPEEQVSSIRNNFLRNLSKLGRPSAWFENVSFRGRMMKMKIDSGSSVNTMPWNMFLRLGLSRSELIPTKSTLVTYSKHVIVPEGMVKTSISLRGRTITDWFMVLGKEDSGTPLLGLGAARALGLFRFAKNSHVEYRRNQVEDYPTDVDSLGVHGEPVHIELKSDAKPVNIPSRRVPLRLKARVEDTLKRMVDLGVIRPVNHPTDWCHPMLATDKKQKGKVRVCIDPKYLNPHIKRPMFQLPDIDALLSELGEARIFATLDLECGFWQVPVTESTSDLLTFGTPYGRFQYLRLPFGVASAPEEFHRRVVQALAGIKGILVYIDDIVIFAKTKEEHDEIVQKVLKALKAAGFSLNTEKCKFAQTKIKFLGHVIKNGKNYPDSEKLEAIRDFPEPKNQKELRTYLGMVGWIRKFRSDLILSLSVFRPLLKEDTPFTWKPEHSKAMKSINRIIADNLSLEVFRPGESLELWTDASPYGYGAVLLQNKRPLYCVSRSLTSAEKNYPQIDLELGAIAWAFERLDAFVYGSQVKVFTDHKPLVAISKKQIGDLSIQQQRMFMCMCV